MLKLATSNGAKGISQILPSGGAGALMGSVPCVAPDARKF